MANNNHNIKVLQTALLEKLPSTRVREQELLCHHTTFKIGGPADLFIEPTTMAELSFTLRTLHRDLHSFPTRRSSDLIFW